MSTQLRAWNCLATCFGCLCWWPRCRHRTYCLCHHYICHVRLINCIRHQSGKFLMQSSRQMKWRLVLHSIKSLMQLLQIKVNLGHNLPSPVTASVYQILMKSRYSSIPRMDCTLSFQHLAGFLEHSLWPKDALGTVLPNCTWNEKIKSQAWMAMRGIF